MDEALATSLAALRALHKVWLIALARSFDECGDGSTSYAQIASVCGSLNRLHVPAN